jgi:hypothetical protein
VSSGGCRQVGGGRFGEVEKCRLVVESTLK